MPRAVFRFACLALLLATLCGCALLGSDEQEDTGPRTVNEWMAQPKVR